MLFVVVAEKSSVSVLLLFWLMTVNFSQASIVEGKPFIFHDSHPFRAET